MIRDAAKNDKADDLVADWDIQCDAHDAAMATIETQRPEPPQPWDDFPEPIDRETPTGFFRSALREAIEEMMARPVPDVIWGYE